jgi:hypothetical protein
MKATTRLSIFVVLVTFVSIGFSLLFTRTRLHYLADGLKGVPRPEVENFWSRQVPLAFGLGILAIALILGLLRSAPGTRLKDALARVGVCAVGALVLLSSMALIASAEDDSPALLGFDWIPRAPSFLLVRLADTPARPTTRWIWDRDSSKRRVETFLSWTVQQQAILDELLRREEAHRLSRADRAVLARKQFEDASPFTVTTRARWPEGVPVRVTVNGRFAGLMPRVLRATADYSGGRTIVAYHGGVEFGRDRQTREWGWTDRTSHEPGLQSIGAPRAGTREVVFDTTVSEAGETIWEGEVAQPIVVGGALDDILRPVDNAEVRAMLQDAVIATLRLSDGCTHVVFVSPSDPMFAGITMGVVVEFVSREAVVAIAVVRWRNPPSGGRVGQQPYSRYRAFGVDYSRERWADLSGDIEAVCAADPTDPQWIVRVRGDGAVALEDFDATAYWAGTVTVPFGQTKETMP